MTYKEKMRKLENWLESQYGEACKKCGEADDRGNNTAAFVAGVTGMVFLQVLNKLNEIERS